MVRRQTDRPKRPFPCIPPCHSNWTCKLFWQHDGCFKWSSAWFLWSWAVSSGSNRGTNLKKGHVCFFCGESENQDSMGEGISSVPNLPYSRTPRTALTESDLDLIPRVRNEILSMVLYPSFSWHTPPQSWNRTVWRICQPEAFTNHGLDTLIFHWRKP